MTLDLSGSLVEQVSSWINLIRFRAVETDGLIVDSIAYVISVVVEQRVTHCNAPFRVSSLFHVGTIPQKSKAATSVSNSGQFSRKPTITGIDIRTNYEHLAESQGLQENLRQNSWSLLNRYLNATLILS